MRLAAIQTAVKARLRHPGWWSATLALAAFPSLISLLAPSPHPLRFYLGPLLFIAVFDLGLFLCPAPWQWTADDRALAGGWRGLLQFMGFAFLLGALAAPLGWLSGRATAAQAFRLGVMVGYSIPILVLLGPAGWIVARAERLAREAKEAQAKARESQWMSNRGAFSPRLLFSNLNHLAALAGENTHSAEQGLVDLAALYRRWLLEAELPLVPLSTDRSLTEQYLSLERKRWGDRFSLRWHLAPDLDGFQVPPLLLQPLLEAALEQEWAGQLTVDVYETLLPGGVLEFRLHVLGPLVCPDGGLLHSIRQRLQSTLGREASAMAAPCPGGWESTLRLPPMRLEGQP